MTADGRDLHRRRLLGQSRPGRLGRDPALQRHDEGDCPAARPCTTNNRMELMAAIAALEALKEPCEVELHTDSKYVMNGITEWIHGWKRNGWKTADKKPVKNGELWQAWTRPAGATRSTGTGSRAMPAMSRTSAPTSWPGRRSGGCGKGEPER